jgi:hypothetical protein
VPNSKRRPRDRKDLQIALRSQNGPTWRGPLRDLGGASALTRGGVPDVGSVTRAAAFVRFPRGGGV